MNAGAIARSRMPVLAALAALALLFIPLFSTPVMPLVDFYDHVARYYVLSHLDSDAVLAANYAAAWKLLPNVGLDVLATPLLGSVPPLIAAKLIVAFILAIQFSGVLFLHRVLWGRFDLLPVMLLLGLLYSFILIWGFSNFLLGLGLVFWNLGLWLRYRDRLSVAIPLCGVGAIIIFFCHGLAFAIYGVLAGGFELGRWWFDEPGRRPATLARSAGALLAQAVVPTALFLGMPTAAATAPGGAVAEKISSHVSDGSLAARLQFEFWHRLTTIFRVAESPYPLLDVLTFSILLGLMLLALWKKWVCLHRLALVPLALAVLLCVVVPPTLFGVGLVSDRMPLVLAMLAVSSLSLAVSANKGTLFVVAVAGAIGAVRIAAVSVGWHEYSREFADFRQVMSAFPKGALLTELHPYSGSKVTVTPRCEMYRPLAGMLDGAVVPLFAFPTQQPLRLIGPLDAAQDKWPASGPPWSGPPPGYFDDLLAKIAADKAFDYLVICRRDRLSRPLPAGTTIAAEAGDITLLKLR